MLYLRCPFLVFMKTVIACEKKAKLLEPKACSCSHCLSCSVKTDAEEIGVALGLVWPAYVQVTSDEVGDLSSGSVTLGVCTAL